MRYVKSKMIRIHSFFEGEGEGGTTGGAEGGGTQGGSTQGGSTQDQERKFTQKEVNAILAKDKDKVRNENQNLLNQLKAINENGLTPEAKEELERKISQLEDQGKTKEQLANERVAKVEKEWKVKHEAEAAARKNSDGRYAAYRTKVDIMSAAGDKELLGENLAINPSQIVDLLQPKTYMAEEMGEDGKPTGELIPRVKMSGIKDGKPIALDLTVTEAVKRMSEEAGYANLFKSGAAGGLGGSNGAQKRGGGTIPKDTKEFMAQWKQDKSKLISGS